MKNKQTLSILIWGYRRKSSDKKVSLYARVTVNKKRAEISLRRSIELSSWDEKHSEVKGKLGDDINEYLDIVRGELRRFYYELRATGQVVTAEAIKNKYLGIDEDKKTLIEVFEFHNEEMKALIGKGVSKGTYKRYEVTLGKIKRFLKKKYKKSDILLCDLKYKFIADFEFFLKTEDNLDHNTCLVYLKKLKKIANLSLKNEWLDRNPFIGFKCVSKEVDREFLTEEEINLLLNKIFPSKRLEEVRDIFLFSCFTGYAYSEVQALTPDHVNTGLDGEKWLTINRKKTNGRSNVMLLPITLDLINKYKDHPICTTNGKLFPVKSNQKYNDYLKEIADICGIKKRLTTHIARHTFATTVTLANDVPIESVSSMLGHRSIRTTQIYAKVVQKKVSNNMKELRNKLSAKSNSQVSNN